MSARITSVSVDVDEVHHYFAIHGLDVPAEASALAYDRALPRIADFAAARGLPVTFFAVGDDLRRPESAAIARSLAARGHAIESHSLSHRYDLTRLDRDTIAREVEEGARAIEAATGRRPVGFRAPGYTVSDALFDALEASGVAFDSSVFPCPPYYLAKAAAMAAMRAVGHPSRSILDTPRVLAAPTAPYRPGARWWRRGARPFVELPVQVTPGLRLPFIGTWVGYFGAAGGRFLAERCAAQPFVNLELHAMDFLDVTDGLAALAQRQPELRVPLAKRMDGLAAALEVLARAGHAFVSLEEAARTVA